MGKKWINRLKIKIFLRPRKSVLKDLLGLSQTDLHELVTSLFDFLAGLELVTTVVADMWLEPPVSITPTTSHPLDFF